MSYLVFARKWRPLTFDDVVGQEHITGTLKKAIEKNRIAHAYIFSGTRGVGKTTTARILARALNCEKGPTPTPCGVCDSCKGISSGSSFDVLEIDGASNNSVDDIRELRDNVGYSSMGGKYRIFVIDEVHMLTKNAFNALLKTLEEPPPNVIFIFATTEPQKIPATIHSRCQRYDFRRIVPEQILERLERICADEKIAFEKSALMLIARKADGSMRDALSLLDQVCSYCPDKLAESEVRLVLGLVGLEVYERIMDAVAAKTPGPALSTVQEILYQGYDLHEFVLGFEEHVRNLLFARINGALESAGAAIEPAVIVQLKTSSQRFSEGDLLRMMEIVRKSENDLKWSALPRFAVEIMLLKLVFLDSTLSLEQLIAMVGKGEGGTGVPPRAAAAMPEVKKKIDVAPAPSMPPLMKEPVKAAVVERRSEESTQSAPVEFAASMTVEEPPLPDEPHETMEEIVDAVPPSAPNFEEHTPGGLVDVKSVWPSFIESIMRDRPNIGTFLSLAAIAGSSDSSIDLTYQQSLKFQFGEMTKKINRDEISRLLKLFIGRPIDVHITLDTAKTEGEARNYINHTGPAPLVIDNEIEREPIIQSVLELFDGEILK
jgi:DNA polymerase III subunit gamma/tau